MGSERAKVSQLQPNHLALSRELAHSREAEMAQRRERGVVEGEVRRWEREGARLGG